MGRRRSISSISADSTVKIRSLYPSRIKFTGLGGKVYDFERPGSELSVLQEDVAQIMSIKTKRACCGGGVGGQSLFEIVN